MSHASPQSAPVGVTAMHSTTVREAMHPGIISALDIATVLAPSTNTNPTDGGAS